MGQNNVEIDDLRGKWAAALDMLLLKVRTGQLSLDQTNLFWRGEPFDPSHALANLKTLDRPEYALSAEISMLARVPRDWTGAGCLELPGDRLKVNKWLGEEPLTGRTQTFSLMVTSQHPLAPPPNGYPRAVRPTVVLFEDAEDLVYMKLKYS